MEGPGGKGFKGREMPGSSQRGQGESAAGRGPGIPMPAVPDDTPLMVLGGVVVVILFMIWIYIQLNPPERRRFLSVPTAKQIDLTSQKGRDHVRRSLTEPDGHYAKISDKEVHMAIPFHTAIPTQKQESILCVAYKQSTDLQRHPHANAIYHRVFECNAVYVRGHLALQSRRFAHRHVSDSDLL
jgi:hypothetical protein